MSQWHLEYFKKSQKSKKDADIIHDRTIGAVGLNGYKQISRDNVNELSRHQKKNPEY